MFDLETIDLPILGFRGLEADLTEEEQAIQEVAHRFAEEIMRPIGEKLDKMTPEEVVAEGSPLHDYMRQIHESGILDLGALAEMDNQQKSRIFPIIFEELGWGDSGLAIATLASSMPAFAAHTTGDPEIIERFGSVAGCWLATQPDRGSDVVDMRGKEVYQGATQFRGNLTSRIDGDDLIVNGPHLLASVTSKTHVTDTAFEVASEALQLFGGNGLTREYPIEKIMPCSLRTVRTASSSCRA